jgi:sugar O-acyltransferase (sialic acid O-acetyltransferase NeuD family)
MNDQKMDKGQSISSERWFVFGASGHGKVVVDAIERTGGVVAFVVDDDSVKVGKFFFGYEVISRDDLLERHADIDCGVVAVGDNLMRSRIVGWLEGHHFSFGVLVHPGASIGRGVSIGKGTVIFAAVVVNSDACIGAHNIINTASSVDHDCVLGDGVHVAPGVRLCGDVSVGDHVLLGVGSVVLPGLNIGAGAVVAAGAVVNRNVAPQTRVGGVPAQYMEIIE